MDNETFDKLNSLTPPSADAESLAVKNSFAAGYVPPTTSFGVSSPGSAVSGGSSGQAGGSALINAFINDTTTGQVYFKQMVVYGNATQDAPPIITLTDNDSGSTITLDLTSGSPVVTLTDKTNSSSVTIDTSILPASTILSLQAWTFTDCVGNTSTKYVLSS